MKNILPLTRAEDVLARNNLVGPTTEGRCTDLVVKLTDPIVPVVKPSEKVAEVVVALDAAEG